MATCRGKAPCVLDLRAVGSPALAPAPCSALRPLALARWLDVGAVARVWRRNAAWPQDRRQKSKRTSAAGTPTPVAAAVVSVAVSPKLLAFYPAVGGGVAMAV
jgi:hypothetical protein